MRGVSEQENQEEEEVDVDFSDEVSALSSLVVAARAQRESWRAVGLTGLRPLLDQRALSITDNKEEVTEEMNYCIIYQLSTFS